MLPNLETQEKTDLVRHAVETLGECFGDKMLQGRGFLTFWRNASFRSDPEFVKASGDALRVLDSGRYWSLHIALWALESSRHVAGDVVVLGDPGILMKFVAIAGRHSLADRITMVFREASSESKPDDEATNGPIPSLNTVYSLSPERVLAEAPDKISLIVMAAPTIKSEVSAFEALMARLEPGALVLIEDFGMQQFVNRHVAILSMVRARGLHVLELATGQGLMVGR